jgi:hypothetical protein
VTLFARENPFIDLTSNRSTDSDLITLLNINNNKKQQTIKKVEFKKSKSDTIQKLPLYKRAKKENIILKSYKDTTSKKLILPKVDNQAIIITDKLKPYIIGCCFTKPHIKKKRKKEKKKKKVTPKFKLIYKNYFLKIVSNGKEIKIYNCDRLISKKYYNSPKRLVLDFKRTQYFKTKIKEINSAYIKSIKIGSHHCFYRITLLLNHKKLSVKKSSFGYLIY